MGIVWRAHNEVLDRTVAVKEVLHRTASEEEREAFNQRTVREARAAGRIAHPGVVVVHDVIEEDGRPWIVMQFVRARSLGAVLREEGPLPPRRIADIGRQVLDALRTAHAAGMAFNQQAARVSFHDSSRSGSAGRLHEVDGCRSRAGADRRRDRLEKAGASPRLPAHPARGRPPARNAGRRVGVHLHPVVRQGQGPRPRLPAPRRTPLSIGRPLTGRGRPLCPILGYS
jgi:hypothetical protein